MVPERGAQLKVKKMKVNSTYYFELPVLVCVATDTISAVSDEEPLIVWVVSFS